MRRATIVGAGLGLWLAVPAMAHAETYEVAAGEDVEAAISMLQPGDTLELGGGMYVVTDRFSISLAGTEAAPITIRAKDGEFPHIHRPDANQNLVDIDNAEWVIIDGIEWSGGSAGIRISGARNLTISNCEIHSTNDVALRANDGGVTYENLHIVGNEIHDTNNTGEGMYLGCNEDGCRIANSVIERNWVHHTNGPTVNQGDGIEIKEGSYGNVVRDNVIHDTNYPCILTYSTVGNGEPNVIEGNAMWNCGDHAIQSAADSVIRNNIIVGAGASGISLQPHQSGAPANVQVVHNTIVVPGGRALNVSGAVGPVTLANNAVYSQAGPAIQLGGDTSQVTLVANIGFGGLSGGDAGYADGDIVADFVAAHMDGGVPNDVFPAMGNLVDAGDPTYATDVDFNGLPRSGADVGAYTFDVDGNPGWTLQPGFKQFPDPDQGGGDTDGGDTDGGDDSGSSGDDSNGGSGPGGGSDGDGDSSGGGGGDASDGGIGSETDGIGPDAMDDGGDAGCGCRSNRENAPAGVLLMLGLGAFLRRRSR